MGEPVARVPPGSLPPAQRASGRLDGIGRVRLAALPTPLDEAPRLARELGLGRLLVKRDDLTGLAMGGTKARKLEYDLAAVAGAAGSESARPDVLLTIGGAQSNHVVATAAAARRLGLDARLVLGGPDFSSLRGNMLLDVLLGAELRYLVDDDDNDSLAAAMESWADELRQEGRRPFTLPIGGSTGLGALGAVNAVRELAAQLGPGPVQLVAAVGSCGTFAGLRLGASLFLPGSRVVGISVSRTAEGIRTRTMELAAESAGLLGIEVPFSADALECRDEWVGEYGAATAAGLEAIRLAARLEGLVLDPVYTGKSMAGLAALARRGDLDPSLPVVFLHTGGLPIVFAYDELASGAACAKIPRR